MDKFYAGTIFIIDKSILTAHDFGAHLKERYEQGNDLISYGGRLVIHIFNTEGDLRELGSFRNILILISYVTYLSLELLNINLIRMHNENMDGPCEDEKTEGKGFCIRDATTQDIQSFLEDSAEENDIILGFTVGFVTIDQELADFIENLVPTFEKTLSNVVNDPIKSRYSQAGFQRKANLLSKKNL